jgi:hypothetical protein
LENKPADKVLFANSGITKWFEPVTPLTNPTTINQPPMTESITYDGAKRLHSWHASVPVQTRPDVAAVTQTIDGVEYYKGIGKYKGKMYIKELFDKRFQVVADRRIKKGRIKASAEKAALMTVGYED